MAGRSMNLEASWLRAQEEEERRLREEAEAKARYEAEKAQREADQAAQDAQNAQAAAQASVAPEATKPQTAEQDQSIYTGMTDKAYNRLREIQNQAMYVTDMANSMKATPFGVVGENYVAQDYTDAMDKEDEIHHYAFTIAGESAGVPGSASGGPGNKIIVDFDGIKTLDQGILFGATLNNQKEKIQFYSDLARNKGVDPNLVIAAAEDTIYEKYGVSLFDTPYSERAKNRTYSNEFKSLGILDYDGSPIDLTKAHPTEVFMAIELEPDSKKRKAAISAIKGLAETPGSAYYGLNIGDLDFMDSATLTQSDYNAKKKEYESKFEITRGELTDKNAQELHKIYNQIKGQYTDPRVQKQMLSMVCDVYSERTGMNAPSPEELDKFIGSGEENKSSGGLFGWLSKLGKKEKTETPELVKPKERVEDTIATVENERKIAEAEDNVRNRGRNRGGMMASSGGATLSASADIPSPTPTPSPSASGAKRSVPSPTPTPSMSAPQTTPALQETAEKEAGTTKETTKEVFGPNLPAASETEEPILYARAIGYDPNMSDETALAEYMRGSTLNKRNKEQIDWLINSPGARTMMYGSTYSGGLGSEVKNANDAASFAAAARGDTSVLAPTQYRSLGRSIGTVANSINSGAYGDMQLDAYLELGSIITEIEGMGLSSKDGNIFENGLAMRPDLQERLNNLKGIPAQVKDIKEQNKLDAAAQYKEDVELAKAAVANGTATAQTLEWLSNVVNPEGVDVLDDDSYLRMSGELRGKNNFFSEGNEYWSGDSLAAKTRQTIASVSKNKKSDDKAFVRELTREMEQVLYSYSETALAMGMTLETFMGSCGMTGGLDDIADIAQNNLIERGVILSKDEELQRTLDMTWQEVGALAVETSAKEGLEGLVNTLYQTVDVVTYNDNVYNIRTDYEGQYGDDGRRRYYNDVMAVIRSGKLSEESAKQLYENLNNIDDVYKLGYVVDKNWLYGSLETSREAIRDDLAVLDRTVSRLGWGDKALFNVAKVSSDVVRDVLLTKAGVGASKLLRFGQAGAAIVGAFTPEMTRFGTRVEENVNAGMGRELAFAMAGAETYAMAAMNFGSSNQMAEAVYGDDLVNGFYDVIRGKNGKSALSLYAKYGNERGIEEAVEEAFYEPFVEGTFDMLDKEAIAISNGEGISLTRPIENMLNTLEETDPLELGKEFLVNFGAGYVFGGLIGIADAKNAHVTASAGKGALDKYDSIKYVTSIFEGDTEWNETTVGNAYQKIQKDMKDPLYQKWLNSAHVMAYQQRNLVAAINENAGSELRTEAVKLSEEADYHFKKAEAAKESAESSKSNYFSLRSRVANGELEAKGDMQTALDKWARAETTVQENNNAAHKLLVDSGEKVKLWYAECIERAKEIGDEKLKLRLNSILYKASDYAGQLSAKYENDMFDASRDVANTNRELRNEEGFVMAEIEASPETAKFEAPTEEEAAEFSKLSDDDIEFKVDEVAAEVSNVEAQIKETSEKLKQSGQTDEQIDEYVASEREAIGGQASFLLKNLFSTARDLKTRIAEAVEMGLDEAAEALREDLSMTFERIRTLKPAYELASPKVAEAEASAVDAVEAEIAAIESETQTPDTVSRSAEEGAAYAESAVFGDGSVEFETSGQKKPVDPEFERLSAMSDEELDAEIEAANSAAADVDAQNQNIEENAESVGFTDEQLEEAKASVADSAYGKKKKLVKFLRDRMKRLFNTRDELYAMDNDDAGDAIQTQFDKAYSQLEALGEDAEDYTMQLFGTSKAEVNNELAIQQEDAELAKVDSSIEAATYSLQSKMEHTASELERITPAYNYIRNTPIFINSSQAADILHRTGAKNISSVNTKYGTRFTTKANVGAMPLDGHVLSDIDAEGQGVVNANSTHPDKEILDIAEYMKELKAEQKKHKQEAADIAARRKEADARRREAVARRAKPEANNGLKISRMATSDAPAASDASNKPKPETTTGSEKIVSEAKPEQLEKDRKPAPLTKVVKQSKENRQKIKSISRTARTLARKIGEGWVGGTRKMGGVTDSAGYHVYEKRFSVIGENYANSLSANFHELGHAVHERLGIKATQRMIDSWKSTFVNASAYKDSEIELEAFAEMFWRWMRDEQDGINYAGEDFIDAMVHEMKRAGIYKDIVDAQNELRAFEAASAMDKVGAMIVNAGEDTRDLTLKEKLQESIRKFVSSMTDKNRAAEAFDNVIRDIKGENHLDVSESIAAQGRIRDSVDDRVSAILVGDIMIDGDGNVIGESLKPRLAKAGVKGKDFEAFVDYWVAVAALDRETARKYKDKNGKWHTTKVYETIDKDSVSIDQLKAAIKAAEEAHPEFKDGVKVIQEFNHDLMQAYMVDTGRMTAEQLDRLEKMYPHYAPLHTAEVRSSSKFEVKGIKGSTKDKINPMDTYVQMVGNIVRQDADNRLKQSLVHAFDKYNMDWGKEGKGLGWFMREITDDMVRKGNDAKQDLANKVNNAIAEAGVDSDVYENIYAAVSENETRVVGAQDKDVIRVQDGDKVRYFEILDKPLLTMLSGNKNIGEVIPLLGMATRTMSKLTTTMNVAFGIPNALRDFQSSVNYGTWAKNYWDGTGKWFKTLIEVWKGKSDAWKEYVALGGGDATRMRSGTKKSNKEYRSALFDDYEWNDANILGKVAYKGKQLTQKITNINDVIEQASRFAEYKYGAHDRSTTSGRQEAFLAAMDVTTDFGRRGSSEFAQVLREVVPFFNASMQGMYRTARQLDRAESDMSKIRFTKTVTNTAIASAIMNAALFAFLDDDEKEEFYYMSDDLKSKNFFFPNPMRIFDSSVPPLLRLPIQQGPMAYMINAAVTNAMWGKDKDNELALEWAAVGQTIFSGFWPIGSTIFDPIISGMTNKNWYGSNIVPTYLESLEAYAQYTEETPKLFIGASEALYNMSNGKVAISPMMLQYWAQQYTGVIGQTAIPMLSINPATGRMGGVGAVLGALGKRITSDPLVSNNVVSSVYDNFNTLSSLDKTGDSGKKLLMLRPGLKDWQVEMAIEEADDLTHSGGALYDAKKQISSLYDEIDAVNARTDLNKAQKYALTSMYRREMIDVARDANETANEFREKYGMNDGFWKRFLGY